MVGGRYTGNQQGGVILGEVFDETNNVTYKNPVLILRETRHALFTLTDGDIVIDKTMFNERLYNWRK